MPTLFASVVEIEKVLVESVNEINPGRATSVGAGSKRKAVYVNVASRQPSAVPN